MPTIIENTQQVNALNEIEAALAIIKSINTIISAGDGALAIVYKAGCFPRQSNRDSEHHKGPAGQRCEVQGG